MSKNIYDSITSKFSFNNKSNKKTQSSKPNNENKGTLVPHDSNPNISKEKINYESVKQTILQRRSIRRYTPHKPPYRLICDIMQTACSTPRSGNIVPFHTIIVQDKSIIATIANLCYQQSWIAQAPYVLVITTNSNEMYKLYPDMATRFSTQTTASYINNLILLAQASGLSSCWVESMQEEVLKDYLDVPKSQEIHAILPIGYAKEINDPPSTPSFLSLVSFNSYGNKENKD